jgi:hypothetical protein
MRHTQQRASAGGDFDRSARRHSHTLGDPRNRRREDKSKKKKARKRSSRREGREGRGGSWIDLSSGATVYNDVEERLWAQSPPGQPWLGLLLRASTDGDGRDVLVVGHTHPRG